MTMAVYMGKKKERNDTAKLPYSRLVEALDLTP